MNPHAIDGLRAEKRDQQPGAIHRAVDNVEPLFSQWVVFVVAADESRHQPRECGVKPITQHSRNLRLLVHVADEDAEPSLVCHGSRVSMLLLVERVTRFGHQDTHRPSAVKSMSRLWRSLAWNGPRSRSHGARHCRCMSRPTILFPFLGAIRK